MTDTELNMHLDGLEILVVEDDATSALLMSRILTLHGARVDIAVNGSDGLAKFREHRYPVVITDINMPVMNGLELVSRIKELGPDAQVIATSANRETDCLISAIELGFSDYLLKPVEIEKLIISVKRCGDIFIVRQQLESEREKFRTVVDCLGEGIAIKDLNHRILYQNRALTEMFGDFTGSACYEMFDNTIPCEGCPTVLTLQDGQAHSACKNKLNKGNVLYVESTSSLLGDSRGTVTGTITIIRDISDRIKNEQIIRDLAFCDPLTGLANRRLFVDRLEQAIAKCHRYGTKFALLNLDIDHFKTVNDTLGHESGDVVLQKTAERIKSCCQRDLDTISRYGGDEFCIILTDCGERTELEELAKSMLQLLSKPIRNRDSDICITTSIGISIFPDDGTDAKSLEEAADKAMYSAKRAGRNTYRFFAALATLT
ncbi:MAG: diguanylate cyclase [Desulfuromonadaceae bacterium]|nr:diguanylate cyclase [Desulfuromonadaceae bacterium]